MRIITKDFRIVPYWVNAILLVIMIIPHTLLAQRSEVDSLVDVLHTLPEDTSKVNFINQNCLEIMDDDYDLAYQLSTEAMHLAKKINYQYGLALSLENMGIYKWYNGYYDHAIDLFKKAIGNGGKFNDQRLMAESFNRIGLVFYYQAVYDSAQYYHLKSLTHFRNMDDSLGVARIWYHIGLLYYHQSKYEMAVDYYLKALNLYEQQRAPLSQASLLNKLGQVYQALGQTELIWEKQKELIDLANREADQTNRAQFYEQIGEIYFLTNSYDSALTYFKKALQEFKKIGHINYYDFVNEKIGKIYLSKGEYETALEYMFRVYEIRNEKGTRIHKATVEGGLADIYHAMKNWNLAIEHYSKALSMHKEMGNAISLAKISASLAEAYCRSGQYDEAIVHALNGLERSKEIFAQNTEIDNLRILSNAYLKKRSLEKAYAYLSEYHDKKEELTKGKTLQRISHLQMQYIEAKNEREIAELKQKEILQEAEIDKQRLLFTIFFILFLLILSVSILLYNRYLLNAKNNELLSLKNKEIEEDNQALNKKNKEGELLLAEIRHRIKNNLQTISSLLNMHSRQLSSQQQSLVQESHDRVRAMALIHQKLHKDTRYAYVDLPSYLEELAQNLVISYGLNELKLNLKVAPLSVEADSAVYIGLIANELISNAMKHAFKETESPALCIKAQSNEKDNILLSIRDNGVGFSGEAGKEGSFGIKLISILIEEMEGSLTYKNRNGTEALASLKCPIFVESDRVEDHETINA